MMNEHQTSLEETRNSNKDRVGKCMRANALLLSILVSMAVGFAVGGWLRQVEDRETAVAVARWLSLPGELFMRALELFTVPFIFVAICVAMSHTPAQNNVRVTAICFALTVFTHLVAAVYAALGCFLLRTAIIPAEQPSQNIALNEASNAASTLPTGVYEVVADILRNAVPRSFTGALTSQEVTR